MDAVSFLKAFHPANPWVLTAITVDKKYIETVTFSPADAGSVEAARAWIAGYVGKRNLYFTVNVPTGMLTKKAQKSDIAAAAYLHVDVDARAGEAPASEFERIRKLLVVFEPKPTFIVFSGGGYQAFWRLAAPLADNPQQVEPYNKQLELLLGGDNCWNVDRIMRLPGTMNIPDAKKAERGRVPAAAEVYSYNADTAYTLANFTPARLPEAAVEGQAMPVVPDVVARLASVDELDQWRVPDRVKVVVVQGHDPDNPKKDDNSRSAWLFDACCQLVRAGVPDDVIYSVVTDPDFAISGSVLDKGSAARKYAIRQIARARDEVEDPNLRRMNERYLVIGNLGGKCRVVEEVFDPVLQRPRLTKQSFTDFKNRFGNEFVVHGQNSKGEDKYVPLGQWWLAHQKRRQHQFLVFSPNGEVPDAYNLWQGFACAPVPGDAHLPFLQHVHDNICGGEEMHYRYLLGWMARAVQYPARPGEVAVVLRGKSGTGKSFFAKQFGAVWGRHFLQVSDAKHLVGSFNAHLRDCVVLFGDEAFFAGDKKHESVLKTLITEESMIIEHKGVDAEVSPNFIHLILASNSEWVVPMGAAERRFFVLDVGEQHQRDTAYFKQIAETMAKGGRESLLHYLLTYDLKGYDVRRVPATRALLEQKMHSLSPMHEWWLERLLRGTIGGDVLIEDLVTDYVRVCVQYNVPRRGSTLKLGMFLRSVCPKGYPERKRATAGSRNYYYTFPTLLALREHWDSLYGGIDTWPDEHVGGAQADPI